MLKNFFKILESGSRQLPKFSVFFLVPSVVKFSQRCVQYSFYVKLLTDKQTDIETTGIT